MSCVVVRTGPGLSESLSTDRIHARDFVRAVSWTRQATRGAERARKTEAVGPGDCQSGQAAARSATRALFVVSWRDRCFEGAAVFVHCGKRAGRFSQARSSERGREARRAWKSGGFARTEQVFQVVGD